MFVSNLKLRVMISFALFYGIANETNVYDILTCKLFRISGKKHVKYR